MNGTAVFSRHARAAALCAWDKWALREDEEDTQTEPAFVKLHKKVESGYLTRFTEHTQTVDGNMTVYIF